MTDKQIRIERAKQLLQTVRHATMATVNQDGSPHNSPFFFMHDQDLTRLFWGSHPDSMHSQNIIRTGQLFVVIYDAFERGGLYIQASDGHSVSDQELDEALTIHNMRREKENKVPLPKSYYQPPNPQKMWVATIDKLWVNGAETDENGRLKKDIRYEITSQDLLSKN